MNRFILFLPLIVFVFIASYFALGLRNDPSRIPSVLIDKPLPDFELPAIEGRNGGLADDDVIGRVALVNVFASWCIPCAIEHPVLMRIAEEEDNLLIAGINWKEKPGDGGAWLERLGDPYDFIGDDADGRVAIDFGVTGAPETFVVDHKGRIRYKHVGPITEQFWKEDIKPIVDQLQAEAG
ncbi:MAG: DsbE family thiol:disulfide interchange protein [Pseudomonadota bacterium]